MTTTDKQEIIKEVSFPVTELMEIQAIQATPSPYPDGIGEEKRIPVLNRKAIYREDTGKILALPSKKYNLILHGQVVESVFNEFDKAKIEYTPVKTELLGGGAHLYMHLRTPEVYTIGDSGDAIQMETIITNSYDCSSPFGMELGGNRLICTNGMRAYRKDMLVTKKHYTFNTDEVVKKFLDQVKKFKEIFLPFLQTCAEYKVTPENAFVLIENMMLGKKYKRAATEQYHKESKLLGNNAWALYNALTYVATHVTKGYMVRRGVEIQAFRTINQLIES